MRWVEHVARMGQMRNTKLLQQNMKVTLGRHAYMRTWYYKMDLEIGCGLDRSGYWQRAVGMGRHTAQGFLWYVKRAPLQLQLIAYYIFISLISMLILSSHFSLFPFRFSSKVLYAFLISPFVGPILATWPIHLIRLHLIALAIFGEY